MNMPSFNNQLTMSSLEIAELCEKQHKHVMTDIRKMLKELELHAPDFSAVNKSMAGFSAVYQADNGQLYECFNLPRRECDILISGYNIKYRAAIVDRWQELEGKTPVLNDLTVSAYLKSRKAHLERLEREAAQIKNLLFFDDAKGKAAENQGRMGNTAELIAVKDALERRLKSGENKISVSQLRDNIKNLKAFNGAVKLTSRLKNELLPRLAEDGYCVLDNNTIHIHP